MFEIQFETQFERKTLEVRSFHRPDLPNTVMVSDRHGHLA